MSDKRGMSLVEISIVVAFLLLIAAIGIPAARQNLFRQRAAVCAGNLELIRSPAGAEAPLPVCPSGGTYSRGAGAGKANPTCTIPGHHF